MGDQGARLIGEVVPATENLATKDDIQELRLEFAEFRAEIRGWLLKFFVPLWIGVYAALGAMIVSIVVRG